MSCIKIMCFKKISVDLDRYNIYSAFWWSTSWSSFHKSQQEFFTLGSSSKMPASPPKCLLFGCFYPVFYVNYHKQTTLCGHVASKDIPITGPPFVPTTLRSGKLIDSRLKFTSSCASRHTSPWKCGTGEVDIFVQRDLFHHRLVWSVMFRFTVKNLHKRHGAASKLRGFRCVPTSSTGVRVRRSPAGRHVSSSSERRTGWTRRTWVVFRLFQPNHAICFRCDHCRSRNTVTGSVKKMGT